MIVKHTLDDFLGSKIEINHSAVGTSGTNNLAKHKLVKFNTYSDGNYSLTKNHLL